MAKNHVWDADSSCNSCLDFFPYLAAKVAFDPVTLVGVGVFAAANQAGNTPNYHQGLIGYS